jgi:hypothetical protein
VDAIGDADGFRLVLEASDRQGRTRHLFRCDPHVVRDIHKDRGLHNSAGLLAPSDCRFSVMHELGPVGMCDVDIPQDLVELVPVGNRAHLRRRVHRITQLHGSCDIDAADITEEFAAVAQLQFGQSVDTGQRRIGDPATYPAACRGGTSLVAKGPVVIAAFAAALACSTSVAPPRATRAQAASRQGSRVSM